MKSSLYFGVVGPVAELVIGYCWLAGGQDWAGRLLTFYWWLIVAALLGFSLLAIVARMAACAFPESAPTPRALRYWLRTLFFARVVAQVAIGCTSLAVLSMTGWLFSKLTLAIVADGEKKAAGA
ncbi:hypothetical protein ACFSHT_15770 [Paraburkholderia silviterrae]|uniref:Uncharacterized protein n=1 Tax=Paraburkholderia silviterrae TaxID=2528715 RepID=A0A4R5M9F9_9BURK|nr:hypothetical protein [Paraburkholderia silviterrae]TDG23249.1 hypothetical protein EYW47_15065 [Paraburkholderia silviterrae]